VSYGSPNNFYPLPPFGHPLPQAGEEIYCNKSPLTHLWERGRGEGFKAALAVI